MAKAIPNPVPISEEQQQREGIFLQAVRETLPSLRLHTDVMLKRKIGAEKVDDLSLELASFMKVGAGELNRTEQVALACQMMMCLSKFVSGVLKIHVSLKTLLDSFGLLEAAVDLCFPGYFANKLLRYSIYPLRSRALHI